MYSHSISRLLTSRVSRRGFASSSILQSQSQSHSLLLAGKRCIITGASRGIGAEIARRFAQEGASCILIGRNEGLLDHVKKSLKMTGKEEEHKMVVGDVGKIEFWGLMRKEVSD